MPELPEVESVRRSLHPLIEGHSIKAVDIHHATMVKDIDANAFQKTIRNRTFKNILRRGKHLIFDLDGVYMLIHLRMEGRFLIKAASETKKKHEHVRFTLDDGRALIYHDVRKFGTMRLRTPDTLHSTPPLSTLGPEPFDEAFNEAVIHPKLGTKRPIKAALLDQTTMSGIGNIYADEILFCAGLHPGVAAYKVKRPTLKRIIQCSKSIIRQAVDAGGTTIRTYQNALGIDGRFQLNLKVHTLEGMPCTVCGQAIRKTKVATRGTYFCPVCQKRR
ncbi:MAG: DNA-formamidopyrimidine glycosylase [Bacillota bacterium]